MSIVQKSFNNSAQIDTTTILSPNTISNQLVTSIEPSWQQDLSGNAYRTNNVSIGQITNNYTLDVLGSVNATQYLLSGADLFAPLWQSGWFPVQINSRFAPSTPFSLYSNTLSGSYLQRRIAYPNQTGTFTDGGSYTTSNKAIIYNFPSAFSYDPAKPYRCRVLAGWAGLDELPGGGPFFLSASCPVDLSNSVIFDITNQTDAYSILMLSTTSFMFSTGSSFVGKYYSVVRPATAGSSDITQRTLSSWGWYNILFY